MPAENEPTGAGEVLSQSEVEKLLSQVADPANNPTLLKTDERAEPQSPEGIQPYNFRHPAFLTPTELRRLRLRSEEFVRALAARLSIYLRMEFTLQMLKLQPISYQKFCAALPNPTHLSLFKAEPLRGIGILEIHPRLGLTMVDRLLGGSAQAIVADHEFSEIEMALLDQAVHVIVSEWCNQWAPLQEIRPTLLGHENNGQFLQTAPHDTLLLVLAMESKIGDCLEQMQIALPCVMLEPLVRQLGKLTEAAVQEPTVAPVTVPWNKRFDDVPVPITAVWEDLPFTARQLANLKVGDVLPLDADGTRHVRLRLANMPKFQGRLGTTNGKWAVALTEVLRLSS